MRFQQFTGPVMAKSVEDTAFYCFNRFVALNEVGGDPGASAWGPKTFIANVKSRRRIGHGGCWRLQLTIPSAVRICARA